MCVREGGRIAEWGTGSEKRGKEEGGREGEGRGEQMNRMVGNTEEYQLKNNGDKNKGRMNEEEK